MLFQINVTIDAEGVIVVGNGLITRAAVGIHETIGGAVDFASFGVFDAFVAEGGIALLLGDDIVAGLAFVPGIHDAVGHLLGIFGEDLRELALALEGFGVSLHELFTIGQCADALVENWLPIVEVGVGGGEEEDIVNRERRDVDLGAENIHGVTIYPRRNAKIDDLGGKETLNFLTV